MSPLAFRNVRADPAAPVESWPYEALVTAIERGTIGDWVRITAAVDREPWGEVARQVEDYLSYARPPGVTGLLERAVARARTQAERAERRRVAAEIGELIQATGLSLAEVARRMGTSRSRLSTYRSGSVTPSAALRLRLLDLVDLVRRDRSAPGRQAPGASPTGQDTPVPPIPQ